MYFYIVEPNSPARERQIKRAMHFINLHGITGETATPTPSQPLPDLVARAVSKGYNTVVALGGDPFIREVASLLTKSDIAFGAVPIGASEAMEELLGVRTVEQAILSLKQRRLADIGVGVISPGKIFLTEATVTVSRPSPVVVESKTFRVEGTFTDLTIERQDVAAVRFSDQSKAPPQWKRFSYWLVGRQVPDVSETVLRAPTLRITTLEPLPVVIDGANVATTPCKVRVVPQSLKLIQARASLEQQEQ